MSTGKGMDEEQGEQPSRKTAQAPYTKHHPVPTIQKYRGQQQERRQVEQQAPKDPPGKAPESDGTLDKFKQKLGIGGGFRGDYPSYRSVNRNEVRPPQPEGPEEADSGQKDGDDHDTQRDPNKGPDDTTEADVVAGNARQKRKAMKNRQPKGTRVVTDPITHLPMTIHDFTGRELDRSPENYGVSGSHPRSDTSDTKADEDIEKDEHEIRSGEQGVQKLFPPPSYQQVREEMVRVTQKALLMWVGGMLALLVLVIPSMLLLSRALTKTNTHWYKRYLVAFPVTMVFVTAVAGLAAYTMFLRTWLNNHVTKAWDTHIWAAARKEEVEEAESSLPESTQWLNRLLTSIWPLINPDLFVPMADMIEDVMQASLPRFVRMVAIEDLGQGSEAVRILGVRWLPTAAAAKSVDVQGNIKTDEDHKSSDRTVPGKGQVEQTEGPEDQGSSDDEGKTQEQDNENIAEGLEKEEGEFVNMEVAFSYRATETDKRLSNKAKNVHLLIKFYMPGSVPIPVWVTLQGIVGIIRIRLQLTPDPPFIALATLTLVGQPKAEMQAIPLTKHFLNVMDLPFLSGFVQSSIDAALAEYVAPKSLTLNIKEMLMGGDSKKDTLARGVLVVRIKKAYDFIETDPGIPGIKQGSADPYITVGWAKFGKPLWSTRVILKTMHPIWDETAFLLVTPDELNASERIRLQLWDSDRFTADDDAGRIEVDLKEIMYDHSTRGKMFDRKDGFIALQGKGKMPGTLEWSVGYFPKVKLTDEQIRQQQIMPDIHDRKSLKEKVDQEVQNKLREANEQGMSEEIWQNKEAGFSEKEREMAAAAPPPEGYPTGIFSIQLHNITGLYLQLQRKSRDQLQNEGAEASEVSDDLPSAYATVIINGQKVFKTRTKPKNSKPFFNAATERLIRDWRSTEVIVSVRDARVYEDDALIGLIYLKLSDIFSKSSHFDATYPLAGGVGFGRLRISMVFRACMLKFPKELLGWEYGTLELGTAKTGDLPQELRGMRIKARGPVNRGKLHSSGDEEWEAKHGGHVKLAINHRYSSCITLEFRKSVPGRDRTAAFGILWLKDIPDNEARCISIPIWREGKSSDFERARTNCLEECGERMGTLKLDLKYWPGLSNYHRPLAKKNKNIKDVLEVLETAHDASEIQTESDSSDSSDDEDDSSHGHTRDRPDLHGYNHANYDDDDDDHDTDSNNTDGTANGKVISLQDSKPPQLIPTDQSGKSEEQEQRDGKRGPLEAIRDYGHHRKALHRQHRGAMQWQGPRTAMWMKHKLESGKDKLTGLVSHHDRDAGVETEV